MADRDLARPAGRDANGVPASAVLPAARETGAGAASPPPSNRNPSNPQPSPFERSPRILPTFQPFNLRTFPLLVVAVLLLLSAVLPARAASDFGSPVTGVHVYDRTGLLTPGEIADLERRARAVEDAGAPVVVYLQERDANQDQTRQDAIDLMDAWDVQSAPGARDGVVLFLNLEPGNLRHGEVFLYVGETHFQGGNLPQYETDRIINDVVLPLLADERTAEGIGAGLDAIATDLRAGPPPPPEPSAFSRFMDRAGAALTAVLAALAVAIGGYAGLTAYRIRQSRPRSITPAVPTTYPPSDLPPAVVGALVTGRVDDGQLEATVLDLARRGALAIEPAGKKKAQIRLLDPALVRPGVEQEVWAALERLADGTDVVSPDQLGHLRGDWTPAKDLLRRELEARGWYDPTVAARRRPAYIAGGVALAIDTLLLVLALVAGQYWAVPVAVLVGVAGLAAIIVAASVPDTTREGEAEAAPWRGYREGLKQARGDRMLDVNLNLDDAMPYAVAMGAAGYLDKRLKAASKAGYAPAWLGPTIHRGEAAAWDGGFYPYWVAFHGSVTPSSSGGGAGGGASGGGGGSGGSF